MLTLQNDASGTIEAVNGTLTIDTGNAIHNAGVLEAYGGTLDIQDSVICNTGDIDIYDTYVASSLVVDTSTLQLTGGGDVFLSGGQIIDANVNSDPTLENVNNTLSGAGTIGSGDGGTYFAERRRRHSECRRRGFDYLRYRRTRLKMPGLIEATYGGGLDIQDTEINNTGAIFIGGESTPGSIPATAPR